MTTTKLSADALALNADRLLLAPAVLAGSSAARLEGSTRGTLIVLPAMPAAVMTTMLTTEFRAQPHFVTGVGQLDACERDDPDVAVSLLR